MRSARSVSLAAMTFTVGVSVGSAHADEAGAKALAQVEAAMNKAATNYFEYEATTQEQTNPAKVSRLSVWMKGEKRLTEFTAPADLKGTKLLILSPTETYVYLPAFGKVRRIANNANEPGVMGLAFGANDLATQKYSGRYTAAQVSSSDKEIKIALTPQAGQTAPYAKIQMTIARDRNLPTEITYFGSDGKLTRTETRSDYTCTSGVCTPGTLQMVDHGKNQTTKLVRKQWKVNEPIGDDVLSKRSLER